MLLRVPNNSTTISFALDTDSRYVWVSNEAGIRKRSEFSLDVWSKVSLMNEIPEDIRQAIGKDELKCFLEDSGFKENHALLFVQDELKSLADKRPWEQ